MSLARLTARLRTWRGSPSYGSLSGVWMSANIRATPPPSSSGRQGRTANVLGSGIAIMSDSSIALKPVIEEPSKPMPPSKASSSCSELMENDFSWPRMSVNQSRMKRMFRSWTRVLMSSGACGRSIRAEYVSAPGRRGSVEPAVGPRLQLLEGGREVAAHRGQLVLHARGRGGRDPAVDHAALLELLHALGEQPVGEVRD